MWSVFRIILYICGAAVAYLFFLKSPTMVLFILGVYIFYRFVAGGSQHAEHQFYVKVVDEMNKFNYHLNQISYQLSRVSKALRQSDSPLDINFDEDTLEGDSEF
jgi:hypothetical protein